MKTYVIFDRFDLGILPNAPFYVTEAATAEEAWNKARKVNIEEWPPEPGERWDIIEARPI